MPVALAVTGLPAGVSAAFGSTSVTSGSATTLKFTIAASAKPGSYALVVSGSGSSAGTSYVHYVNVTLTVTLSSDFTLSLVPFVSGTNIGVTVVTSAIGSALPVSLSVSGVPAGMTGTFAARQITAGGSTTMTLTRTATVRAGTYPIVISGTATVGGTTVTHSATVTLTVV